MWTKVKSWFGYRGHLMADTRYEVPVSYRVTKASRSEVRVLDEMVDEGLGGFAGRKHGSGVRYFVPGRAGGRSGGGTK